MAVIDRRFSIATDVLTGLVFLREGAIEKI